jgi:hypothetical protein
MFSIVVVIATSMKNLALFFQWVAVQPLLHHTLVVDRESIGISDSIDEEVHHIRGGIFAGGEVQSEGGTDDSTSWLGVPQGASDKMPHIHQSIENIRFS